MRKILKGLGLRTLLGAVGTAILVTTLAVNATDKETGIAEAKVVQSVENVSPIHYYEVDYEYEVEGNTYNKHIVLDGCGIKTGDTFNIEYYIHNPAQQKREFVLWYIISITICTYSAMLAIDDIQYKRMKRKE